VKVFHVVAEPVKRKIAPFKTIDAWGYNGSCPGPTIQVQQGRPRACGVREPAAGVDFPALAWSGNTIEQDGVPYISQKPSRQARNMSTNSQCTRKARSSTTRTAPCRR